MILEVWSTEEFHRQSDASKRNRLKQTDGKISSHCGGSVSFASYRASMVSIKIIKHLLLYWVNIYAANYF